VGLAVSGKVIHLNEKKRKKIQGKKIKMRLNWSHITKGE
jgi:hypothetical protein